MSTKHVNHLANEKSPYLLQHAHNPIDWYSWGEAAFTKAREEDKPIFFIVAIVRAIGAMFIKVTESLEI